MQIIVHKNPYHVDKDVVTDLYENPLSQDIMHIITFLKFIYSGTLIRICTDNLHYDRDIS